MRNCSIIKRDDDIVHPVENVGKIGGALIHQLYIKFMLSTA